MRILVQRVLEASVTVNDIVVSKISKGLLILLGINNTDTKEVAEAVAQKTLKMRLWNEISKSEDPSEDNKKLKTWATCVTDNNYELLVVSQFTLYGYFNGNKPDFHNSRNADEAKVLYEHYLQSLAKAYKPDKVQGGAFQQYMKVSLVNDGPVTLSFDYDLDDLPKKRSGLKINPRARRSTARTRKANRPISSRKKLMSPKTKRKTQNLKGNPRTSPIKRLKIMHLKVPSRLLSLIRRRRRPKQMKSRKNRPNSF